MFDILPLKGGLDNVEGFFSGGAHAGLKPNGKNDTAFIRSDTLCDVGAVFTANKFQAAPIKHFKRYGETFQTNFVLINSKNANAMTGKEGVDDIDEIFSRIPHFLNAKNPIMSSTGVIGYRLDTKKIAKAFELFDFNAKNSNAAAEAIMTTDRFKKEIAVRVDVEGKGSFHIGAICKGAGMICPSLATMLCFITTDANVPRELIATLLRDGAEESFNAISVDGDTSTNDTVMLLSSAKSGVWDEEAFREALKFIMKHLALEIVKDGEGSKKVVAFEVKNAASEDEAKKAAKALSNSLLVKTAIFGEDPNWGRIASTIGASGVTCEEDSLTIHYDDVLVYSPQKKQLDKESEAAANKVMKQESFKIICDLGAGDKSYTAYGCDLGHEYVSINADYRS
ncbi:MAG: bifunctional glutamate N-acetyltransferase/amino-acid acetyltransferase ArgJ [Campylobacteraceae bacterium]|jgi:glutamate N-acetyltransferase/amino-acid N-acetyltransferase|nr:bifunctional glutamate N-acetyltransferase/amino-acid acetyltransferase ArgJ [Campylobacteraceae bacterium]